MNYSKQNHLFFISNLFFTTLLAFLFAFFNHNYRFVDLLWTLSAILSTTATLYLIYYILIFYLFRTKFAAIIIAILSFITNILLLGDLAIYRVWGFHINAMVINIITSPAAYDSLYFSIGGVFLVLGVIAFLGFFEFFLYKKIQKIPNETLQTLKKYSLYFLLPSIFIIIAIEKITFALADVKSNSYILERSKVIPLYQPLTMHSFLVKKLGIKEKSQTNIDVNFEKITNLNYPIHPLKIKNLKTPHIFFFGIDALRGDIISKEVTPNIYKFSQDALDFKYNISGGNNTRFGLFSFFYGINSNYWFSFLNAKKGSVLFSVLKQLNYDISIFSSANMRWPEFRKTIFYDIQDKVHDKFQGSIYQKDAKTLKAFQEYLQNAPSNKPLFSFVWLDSVHAKAYPQEYRKFLPDNATNDYLTVNKTEKIKQFNRYKNAAFYTDALFGSFIKELRQKGFYNNSIIILFSDHGQEFYEHGHFGHNSAYDKEQVLTPMIIHLPNTKPKTINHMSSHLDVLPTLLTYLGVSNPTTDYAHGKNLFSPEYKRDCSFIGNWNENAIVCTNYTIIISNILIKGLKNKVYDTKTYIPLKDYNQTYINHVLLQILQENRMFKK